MRASSIKYTKSVGEKNTELIIIEQLMGWYGGNLDLIDQWGDNMEWGRGVLVEVLARRNSLRDLRMEISMCIAVIGVLYIFFFYNFTIV